MLQNAVREKNQVSYDAYSANARKQVRAVTLRGLLDFDFAKATAIPIEQVEPWHEIVKRFATGAMSYGSISLESHAALAVAMNRIVRLTVPVCAVVSFADPISSAGWKVEHGRGRRRRRAL